MKGEITLKILERVGETMVGFADLTAAFLSAGYGASSWKIMDGFERRQTKRDQKQMENLKAKRQQQRFYSMFHRLKKDGLIEENIKNDKSFFQITSKGRQRLKRLKERQADALPGNSYKTCDLKKSKFTIIVFDIPESERKKRAWLRSALKNLNFKMIQQSVWIGKVRIPEEFLSDLRNMHLTEYVEIFEISKTGSLQQIIK